MLMQTVSQHLRPNPFPNPAPQSHRLLPIDNTSVFSEKFPVKNRKKAAFSSRLYSCFVCFLSQIGSKTQSGGIEIAPDTLPKGTKVEDVQDFLLYERRS
ncbi:MAG: hypothetical protein ACI4W2_00055 [Eubacterium sp.]